jgi:cytochrome c biogenesis factor
VALVRRSRRRYGGYLVHAGVAVLFVGVAASSSFHSVRDVRLTPGQTATVGSYRVTYLRPTARLVAASNGRLERISLGARLRVQRGSGRPELISTSRDFFPSESPSLGPVSRCFADERDVRLAAGQSARVGGYELEYVRPTADLRAASNGRLERIDFGADVRVKRDGRLVTTMHTERSYFPSSAPMLGPVSRFFEGESTSEVGLREGWRRDVWTVVSPDTSRLRPRIAQGDRVFSRAKDLTPEQANMFLAQALDGLVRSYAKDPPPANFRLLISPLVTWIWVGALIVLLGGLLAAWPTPRGMARVVRARYAARVGREVRIPA